MFENFSISTISKSMRDPFNSTELQLNILMFSSTCHLSSLLFSLLLHTLPLAALCTRYTHTHIFCVFVAELHFRSMLYAKSLKAFTVSAIASVLLELDPFLVGIVLGCNCCCCCFYRFPLFPLAMAAMPLLSRCFAFLIVQT